jgi:nitrate/TMAO reductase-like tetraheme cytochrome c subunit
VKDGVTPDCSECHTLNGFAGSLFTIEKHNAGSFQLNGAHLATPCFACHKKEEKWKFREIGKRCADCHEDIHALYIDKKYYPDASCENCHIENKWSEINFEHSKTKFGLEGAHQKQSCKSCHFKKDESGVEHQKFSGLPTSCINCHKDIHYNQFVENGMTDCMTCHDFNNWKASKFDHNTANFKLDGAHQNVACAACHKPVITNGSNYILYKIKDYRCEDCHK